MKISTAFGLVFGIMLFGVGAWFVARFTASAPNLAAEDTAPRTAGAAMVEVQLPATLSAEAATGKTYIDAVCASCHGANAAGQDGVVPPLVHQLYEPSHHGDEAFVVAARIGVRAHHWPFASMPPLEQKLTDGELAAIIRYVRELQRENGIL